MLYGIRKVIVKAEDTLCGVVSSGMKSVISMVGKKEWVGGEELTGAIRKVGKEMARDKGVTGGERGTGLFMRLLFGCVAWVVKRRYRGVMMEKEGGMGGGGERGGERVRTEVVKGILSNELAAAAMAPMKRTVEVWLGLVMVETVLMVVVPYWLLPSGKGMGNVVDVNEKMGLD